MAGPTFKLLCDTDSQYLPPFKLINKSYLGVSISPDEQIIDNIALSLEKTDVFVNKYSLIPITKDLTGEVKQSVSYITRVKHINWKEYHPTRAGIIPYYKTANNVYFCLGEDTGSRQFTDFGGGVGLYETSLDGAIRELNEESLGVFGPITPESLQENIIVTSKQMMIIFLPVPLLPTTYTAMFDINRENTSFVEVTNIFWLTQYQLQGLIKEVYSEGRIRLYYRVKSVLGPVYPALVKLL